MLEQEIERKIEDFRILGVPPLIPRETGINLADNMVSSIIGARRAGKSFRALQGAGEMVMEKTISSLDNVCFIDFDNPILSGMSATDLNLIQQSFIKLNPGFTLKTPVVFILDEIHKIPGWEEYVIELSRNRFWKVLVTGSSSKMMRDEIATELRGKAISTTVYPLSFREFLDFKGTGPKKMSTIGQAETRRFFDEYLKWGSFPAIPGMDEYVKEQLLREYFDTMILKDILQRHNVSKPRQCIHLYHYLLSNNGKPFTIKSSVGFLKEAGFSTSRDSVREYIQLAEDAWLLFTVPIFSHSLKEQERNYKKLYAIDWALANKNSLSWDGSYSRAMENLVYIHLRRKWSNVFYYMTRNKHREVDFLVADDNAQPQMCVQVSMDISNSETLKRELEPLITTARYFGIRENLIITYNQEQSFEKDEISVKAVPAWKWLLDQ